LRVTDRSLDLDFLRDGEQKGQVNRTV